MIPAKAGAVGRQLEVLWTSGTFTGLSDAQLLGRFIGGGEGMAEPAFRELVDRHGPMVMGVCRQILRRPQDADDAFQATFLVLVRKARSVRVRDSLAPWLYGVAYRTAHRARAAASRFRTADVEPMAEAADPAPDGSFELDVRPLLLEELNRLPGKYRDPIVLCHLEGKSHEEAARLLSWPVGTLSGRLSRGRQLLKARLERRGVSVSPTILAARWLTANQAELAPSLVDSFLDAAAQSAAAGTISTSVQSLTQGVLRTMLLNNLKTISMAFVIVGAASGSVAWAVRASRAANPSDPPQAAATAPRAAEKSTDPPGEPFAAVNRSSGLSLGISMPSAPVAKNSPNLVGPRDSLPFLRSASIIVAESPDRRSLEAISLEGATWDRLTLPEGVAASPIISEETLALQLKGKAIKQIAAFSKYTGKWCIQPLRKAAEDEVVPYLLQGGAVYQVGNDIYAFSSLTGLWGVLHLEGAEKPRVAPSANDIEILQGNKLYVFSLRTGGFSAGVEVNPRPFRSEPRKALPAR